MFSEATGARHRTWFLLMSSHLACWLNMESMTCAKASYVWNSPWRPVSRYPSSQPSSVCSDSISMTRPSRASSPPSASSGNRSAIQVFLLT